MSAVLEAPAVVASVAGAVVLSALSGLLIDLTIFPTSVADTNLPDGTNTSNTTNITVSDEERRRYLQQLQAETTATMIPAVVFLVILALTGLVGNSLVILVYFHKTKWTAIGILITVIAMLDLVANVISIPGEIYDMFHIWDFDNPAFCRARLFLSEFTTLSSAMILVAVAVTRYRKVCHPHTWQITTRKAKIISIVAVSLGALFSVPYAILNGRQTKKTPRSDIFAYECTTDDKYVDTSLPLVNYMFFLFLYVSSSASLTVLYILVGVKAWKHRKLHGVPRTASGTAASSKYTVSDRSNNKDKCNSTRPGPSCKRNVDRSSTHEISVYSSSQDDDIKMNIFHLGNEEHKDQIQYNVRVLTDRVEIRTPMVGELFVKLQKSESGIADIASHDNSKFDNTVNENKLQQSNCSGAASNTDAASMVGSNVSGGVMRTNRSSVANIDSNRKYTDGYTHEFLNRENIAAEAASPSDEATETVNTTFHPKERSENTASVHNNVLNLCSRVGNNRQSINQVANEVRKKSDPLSVFKWLDVIFCPDVEQTALYSNAVLNETSLSFRITLSNGLLHNTSWLRNSIIEAMGRQVQIAEGKSDERVPDQIPDADRTNNQRTNSEEYVYGTSGKTDTAHSQSNENSSIRNRLRNMVTKRLSTFRNGSERCKPKRRSIGRTTVMLITISAIYILGFLPHLGLMITKFLSPDVIANLSMKERTFYNLFLRTYFLNCAVNPIVYSLCDISFRRECYKYLKCS